MTTGSLQKWIIEAEIMPKQGVNDPQGEAVMSGLKSLAFAETNRVRVGKLIRVEIEAEDEDQPHHQGEQVPAPQREHIALLGGEDAELAGEG